LSEVIVKDMPDFQVGNDLLFDVSLGVVCHHSSVHDLLTSIPASRLRRRLNNLRMSLMNLFIAHLQGRLSYSGRTRASNKPSHW